jgi:uncharacterized membrane protein YkgB
VWRRFPKFSKRTWVGIVLILTLLDLSFLIFKIPNHLGHNVFGFWISFGSGKSVVEDLIVLLLVFLFPDSDDPSKL